MPTQRELVVLRDTSYVEIFKAFKPVIHKATKEAQKEKVTFLIESVIDLLKLDSLLVDQYDERRDQTQRSRVIRFFSLVEPTEYSDQDAVRKVLNLLLNLDDRKTHNSVSGLLENFIEAKYRGRAEARDIKGEEEEPGSSASTATSAPPSNSSAATGAAPTPAGSPFQNAPRAVPIAPVAPTQVPRGKADGGSDSEDEEDFLR